MVALFHYFSNFDLTDACFCDIISCNYAKGDNIRMIKHVFFDLDGTLLPMDQDLFIKIYFKELTKVFVKNGYDAKAFYSSLMRSIDLMIGNSSDVMNEDIFWQCISEDLGKEVTELEDEIDIFYHSDFMNAKAACSCNPLIKKVVDTLKADGKQLIVATNPVFPAIASEIRMQWGGVYPDDFEYITTYTNSKRCKPNVEYYLFLAEKFGCDPSECLMVGNDVADDMPARDAGWNVFLVTDCLINRKNVDISIYPNGDWNDLLHYIEEIDKT